MKNKKVFFILGGIIIVLVLIFFIVLMNRNNNVSKIKDIKLEKIWNLSYGEEITHDLYKNEEYDFTDSDGDNGFVSISLAQGGYVTVGNNGESSFDQQGIIEYYDLNGNIIWSQLYPNIDSYGCEVDSNFTGVLAVNDGYVVIGYEDGEGADLGIDKTDYNNAIILKYDLGGNLLWNKKYNTKISSADLSNSVTYTFNDILELNNKYYIVGNLNEYEIYDTEESTSFSIDKKYGVVIELDAEGNEISLNKYEEGSGFYDAKVVDSEIIINSLLGYQLVDTDEYFYGTAKGMGLVSFNDNKFELITTYVESDPDYGIMFDQFTNFVYLDGIYYFVDPSTVGKILAINTEGNQIFSLWAEDGDDLENYWLQDLTTDGKYIYVYAYYYDGFESNDMTDSAIIVFDKIGNYQIINIAEQNYEKIVYHYNSLLLVGNENSFTKYIIK